MPRFTVLLAAALVLLSTPAARGVAAPIASRAGRSTAALVEVRYTPPVPLQIARRFAPPAVAYGPGHLGVDLVAARGSAVHPAAAGTVSFAGMVAGRGVVVVAHADGIRTEYEPLRPLVAAGAVVASGSVLGLVLGTHRGCPVASCLHWGARRGAAYLDPLSLLAPLGVVRLLPWRPP